MPRIDTPWTPEKEALFLTRLAETGNVARACKGAKIPRSTAYQHRKTDETFKALWDEAVEIAVGLLEDEAWRRAREGVLEPIFYKGELQGKVRKYSDTLLIFLLKAHNPKKYRENIDVTSGGKPLESDDVIRQDILSKLARIADAIDAGRVSGESDNSAA